MPAASPASAARTASRSVPRAIVAGIPAAVAISAATTLERIPPEPSGEAEKPISSSSSCSKSRTSGISWAAGSRAGSAL